MINIPLTILADKKGFFDRECPNSNCRYSFKIKLDDWKEKVSDERVYCPRCGHVDKSDQWWTQDQITKIEKITKEWVEREMVRQLNKTFSRLNSSLRGSSPIRFQFSVQRNHPVLFYDNIIRQCKEWEKEIVCEKCGTQYSVTGSAFFCPCCGYNSVEQAFSDSIHRIDSVLNSLTAITASMGRDEAEDFRRYILERSLTDIISAFQFYASSLYHLLTGEEPRRNDFQKIDIGSKHFESACGKGYSAWLTSAELSFMTIQFQRRHCLEHCGGIVDQQYIDRSGDHSYTIGQRLVVNEHDVRKLLTIVQKLTNGLNQLKSDKENTPDGTGH